MPWDLRRTTREGHEPLWSVLKVLDGLASLPDLGHGLDAQLKVPVDPVSGDLLVGLLGLGPPALTNRSFSPSGGEHPATQVVDSPKVLFVLRSDQHLVVEIQRRGRNRQIVGWNDLAAATQLGKELSPPLRDSSVELDEWTPRDDRFNSSSAVGGPGCGIGKLNSDHELGVDDCGNNRTDRLRLAEHVGEIGATSLYGDERAGVEY